MRLPAGGTAQVQVRTSAGPLVQQQTEFQLSNPPAGLSLAQVTAVPGGWTLTFQAGAKTVPPGYRDNLLVEAFAEMPVRRKDGTLTGEKRRVLLGVLPALPVEIVQQ